MADLGGDDAEKRPGASQAVGQAASPTPKPEKKVKKSQRPPEAPTLTSQKTAKRSQGLGEGHGYDRGVMDLASNTSVGIKDLMLSVLNDPDTPWYAKGAPAFGAIVALMTTLFAVVFCVTGSEKAIYGFWVCISGLIVFVLALAAHVMITITAMRKFEIVAGAPLATTPLEPTWTRIVPKIPLTEGFMNDLREKLEGICNHARDRLENLGVQRYHVRANIFLLDTAYASEGTCELHIPNGLYVGMDDSRNGDADAAERERNIRFKPNQGATGVAFIKGKSEIARVAIVGDGEYDWPEKYSLTGAQKRAIHPSLKWVISFSLNADDDGAWRSMGVLNVDGLVEEVDELNLNAVMGVLAPRVMELVRILAKANKIRVSLVLEDLK